MQLHGMGGLQQLGADEAPDLPIGEKCKEVRKACMALQPDSARVSGLPLPAPVNFHPVCLSSSAAHQLLPFCRQTGAG